MHGALAAVWKLNVFIECSAPKFHPSASTNLRIHCAFPLESVLCLRNELLTTSRKMRFTRALLLLAAGAVQAASSWSFDDASVSVAAKKGSDAVKEK